MRKEDDWEKDIDTYTRTILCDMIKLGEGERQQPLLSLTEIMDEIGDPEDVIAHALSDLITCRIPLVSQDGDLYQVTIRGIEQGRVWCPEIENR